MCITTLADENVCGGLLKVLSDSCKWDKDQDGSEDSDEPIEDSREEAKKLFQWLIHPVKTGKFFK